MGSGKSSDFTDAGYQPAGIYGWRKQCLYAAILFLLVIVVMNVALTVWILRVLNFNINGFHLGNVQLLNDGVYVDAKAEVLKTLYTTTIVSKNDKLSIISHNSIMLNASNYEDDANTFNIGKKKIVASCDSFEVRDLSGKSRFKVTDKEVRYGIDEVTYSGKAVFNGSIATPSIRGPIRGSLRLESASSSIVLSGRKHVLLEAPEGDIMLKSSNDILFQSHRKLSLNATKLFLKNIDMSTPTNTGQLYNNVYQLCMCQNGRLFLAPSVGRCVTEKKTCS